MNQRLRIAVLAFLSLSAVSVFADDQEKAVKEIKKITAISTDSNMRSVVNSTFADMLKAKRLDLVQERKDMNLNYGGLFLARQLAASGVKLDQLGAQLKSGKNIFDLANEDHANWKQIASEAKKLNKKIDDNIVKYFGQTKKQGAMDQSDRYDAKADKVAADSDMTKEDFAEAQGRYSHLAELAGDRLPTGDANVRNQGQGDSTPTIAAPRAGH